MSKRNNEYQPIIDVLKDFVNKNRLEKGLNKVNVKEAWVNLMGNGANKYTENVELKNKTLYVKLSSSVLRQELSYGTSKIIKMINEEKKKELEAATFKRLVSHLQKNTDLQNIDLMNLAGFCRNCLSKWMVEEAEKMNITLDYEKVRADIYGMDYSEWKKKYQKPIE